MQPATNGTVQGNEIEMRDADSSEDAVMTSVSEGDTSVAGQATLGADIEMQDLSQIIQPRPFASQPGMPSTQPTTGQPHQGCRLCASLGVTRNLHPPAAFHPPANYPSVVQGGTWTAPVCRLCTSLAAQAESQPIAGTTFASSLSFTAATAAGQPFGRVG